MFHYLKKVSIFLLIFALTLSNFSATVTLIF